MRKAWSLMRTRKRTPRRESVPRLRPGLSGLVPRLGLRPRRGAARAAGVPRAFELLDSSGHCPCLLARRSAVRCAEMRWTLLRPVVPGVAVLDAGGAQSPWPAVACRRAGCHADFSAAAFFCSAVGPMRRGVLFCPWSAGFGFGVAEPMPEGGCRVDVACAPGPLRGVGPLPRPCL